MIDQEKPNKINLILKQCKDFLVKLFKKYKAFQNKIMDLKYPLVSDSLGSYILKYVDSIYMGAVIALLVQLFWALILLVMGYFLFALFLFAWVIFCFILLRFLCEKIHAK